jgi:hypothetical protein
MEKLEAANERLRRAVETVSTSDEREERREEEYADGREERGRRR